MTTKSASLNKVELFCFVSAIKTIFEDGVLLILKTIARSRTNAKQSARKNQDRQ